MAELEFVGYDSIGKELEAPQGADTYVAKKAAKFEQPVSLDSTMDGRDIATDGTKLDLIAITQAVDLDDLETRVNSLNSAVVLKGTWDATVGTFPVSTVAGETWICNVAGIVNTVQFEIDDRITAIIDGASQITYPGNWLKQSYTDQVLSVNGKIGAVILVEADISDLQSYLSATSIDSLAKLNALVLDATLGPAVDFATAAQGILAATALQSENIDTLSKLNAVVTDAQLIDTTDSRLSDDRAPTTHSHPIGELTDLGDFAQIGYAIVNLPAGSVGQMARVTDGDASLAWGDIPINSGGGATPYLVWFNGSNWTIVGK